MTWFCYKNVSGGPATIVESRLGHGVAYAAYPDGALFSWWGRLVVPPGSIVRIPEGTQHQPYQSSKFVLVPRDEFMSLHSAIAEKVSAPAVKPAPQDEQVAEPQPVQTSRSRKVVQK